MSQHIDPTPKQTDITELEAKIPSLSGLFVVEVKTTGSITINANGSGEVTCNVAKTGYTPLGVVGWVGSGTSYFCCSEAYLSGNTFHYFCVNQTSASHTLNNIQVRILYMKNS